MENTVPRVACHHAITERQLYELSGRGGTEAATVLMKLECLQYGENKR
jgi:hypothetical protein